MGSKSSTQDVDKGISEVGRSHRRKNRLSPGRIASATTPLGHQ